MEISRDAERQQNARGRVAIIEAHVNTKHRELSAHKEAVSMKCAGALCAIVLGTGFVIRGYEMPAVMSYATGFLLAASAVSKHINMVRPRDQYIEGLVREAEMIAGESGIVFETNYVMPEDRFLGRMLGKLGLRNSKP